MRKWPYRCRKCRTRKTFAKELAGDVECACGGVWALDSFRKHREHKKYACYCSGYPWQIDNAPHRRGSPQCYFPTVALPSEP